MSNSMLLQRCCRATMCHNVPHCNNPSDQCCVGSPQQDAAKEVEQAHPDGIDFLIANAGVGMVNHDLNTPNIELCVDSLASCQVRTSCHAA